MSRFEWKRWKGEENAAELSASGGVSTPPHARRNEDELTQFEISCDSYAPLLTAVFDDEATSEEEHITRLHLERCDHCAQMWRDWENSQLIWRAMPAAKLPPGLLLRILTACRIAAMRPKFGVKAINARRAVARRVPPLAGLFPEVAPPANLQEEILRRTVYAVSRDAEYSHRISLMSWTRQISRWGAAVAVPASLMWMMFLSDSEQSVWQTTEMAQPSAVIQNAPGNNKLAQKPNATRLSANAISKAKVLDSRRLAVALKLPENTRPVTSENSTAENSWAERVAFPDALVSAAPEPQVVSTRVVSTRIVSESLETKAAAIARPTTPPTSASVQFAALSVPVKTSLPKTLSTGSLVKASKTSPVMPRRVVSTRRATSRAKIERAVLRSSSRERAALLSRPTLRSEHRTPGPSVSAPEVMLASVPVRMAAAETRAPAEVRTAVATAAPEEATELEMDDTVRFAGSETEELHAMLNEYQDALLSDDDTSS